MSPSVDDDGAAVAFLSVAGNLDPADKGSGVDTFVARPGPTITLVSRADGAASPAANSSTPFFGSPSVSGDGKDVLFDTLGSVTGDAIPDVETLSIRDLAANSTESVARPAGSAPFSNQGGLARAAVLSADGRYAAFSTSAPGAGLPAGVDEGVVVRDTVTGATFFASDGTNGAPLPDAHDPSISANGRRVAFTDSDSVWVRDLVTGSTILVSRATGANGAVANGASFEPSISADGNRVEFLSAATNLGDGDTDAIVDSHVRDIAAGTTVLASRANGAAGAKGNNAVSDAALSGDGRHVAFSTTATNLGDGDTDATLDVHVRDLAAGATRLADVSSGGAKARQLAEEPTIDADGTHVAFASPATNLATATFPAGQYQIWVRNMAASTTVLASRADGAAGAPGDKTSDEPGLSPDGHVVAYRSSADNLAPGLPPGYQVLRRNLDAGSTQIVSRGRGPDGAPEAGGASFAPGGITTDGSCVAFGGSGGLLGSVAGSTDYEQSYLRVFSRDCGGRTGVAFGPTDTTAPQLRAVSLTHTRFRVAKAATPVAAKRRRRIARGTVLRFTSSEAAKLAIVIERLPAPHGHGRARKLATLTRGVASGAGRISLSGRIGKRRLSAARYRLTLTERDVAGNVSKPVRLTFTVLGG